MRAPLVNENGRHTRSFATATGGTRAACARAGSRLARSPLAWLSACAAGLGLAQLSLAAGWGFAAGVVWGFIALFVATGVTLLVLALPTRTTKRCPFWTSRVIGLGLLVLIGYWQAHLMAIRLQGGDDTAPPLPSDVSMLPQCRNNTNGEAIMNCARLVAPGASGARLTAGLTAPAFTATTAAVADFWQGVVTEGAPQKPSGLVQLGELLQECHLLTREPAADASEAADGPVRMHFRCLSLFLGYADDLVVTVSRCPAAAEANSSVVVTQMFSQSRQGTYDWLHNEFRGEFVPRCC